MFITPWNQKQKNILEKYLNENKIPNAILFSWPEWVWKFEIWKEFAEKIITSSVIPAKAEIQTNFISIWDLWYDWCKIEELEDTFNFPQEQRMKKNPKPKTNTILIDDIRKIIEIDSKTSNWKRVFLIKKIERMTEKASNAFLKTLEESKNSIFICTTENKNLLLSTIISRFQEIEFFKLSDSEIKKFLEEKNFSWNIEEWVKFSFWRIDLAKKFLENEKNLKEIKQIFEEWKKFLENISYSKIFIKSEFLFKNKEKIKDELFFLQNFLDTEWKNFFGEKKFLEIYENFLELKKWLNSNQNAKLVFDNFYLKIMN